MKFCTSLAFNEPEHFCELAKTADASGWDFLAVSDHVVHPEKIESPYPYTEDHAPRWEAPAPWPDPFVAISAMAAVTTRLRFLTSIYVLPLRNPFIVAKALGTLAVMSGYRVGLGIGVGWMKEEFDLLEQSFSNRGRRASEMLEVMRKLWAGGMVEHHGIYYDFESLQMSPAALGRIPIAVGGTSDPALRRAARIGDGWISDIHSTDELREALRRFRLRERRVRRGRLQTAGRGRRDPPPDGAVGVLRRHRGISGGKEGRARALRGRRDREDELSPRCGEGATATGSADSRAVGGQRLKQARRF
jgi:probable F420-dependent oxidoreductase